MRVMVSPDKTLAQSSSVHIQHISPQDINADSS